MMNIVFMGTPEFAVPSLKKILASGFHVSLVVTSPDKPRRSASDNPEPTPIKRMALEFGLPYLEAEDLKSADFANAIRASNPDIIAVVAFRILPKEVFTLASKGTFNLHASLLPKYRGAAPINWALIHGETETGVTTFFLQEKVDTGSVILQKSLKINESEVATELALRLSELGAEAVVETIEQISKGTVVLQPQNEELATKAPKLTKENSRMDWSSNATKVHQFVRGLSERPTAWTTFENKLVKIYRTSLISDSEPGEFGKWIISNDAMYVHCGRGLIEIHSLQFEGKKRMRAFDFLRGYRAKGDEKFV